MKDFSENELTQIEEWASCYMTTPEIAKIMEVEPYEFGILAGRMGNPIQKAIERGQLKSKAAINKSIVEMASRGSSPAQQLAKKMELDLKIANEIS